MSQFFTFGAARHVNDSNYLYLKMYITFINHFHFTSVLHSQLH
jgi:hypothetical protein